MAVLHLTKPPAYFYSFSHPARWRDPYATPDGEARKVLLPGEIMTRGRRNDAYQLWLKRFNIPGRDTKFQAIRVITDKHSETDRRDWWGKYQDCAFRVFVQPFTRYEGLVHKQYYILCPEDAEMLHRFELEQKGQWVPPRDPLTELYVSRDKRLRKMRIIPVESCRHCRHETSAGRIEGL